jgi:hypothetical protein
VEEGRTEGESWWGVWVGWGEGEEGAEEAAW